MFCLDKMSSNNNCCVYFCVMVTIFFQVVGCFLEELRLLVHINDKFLEKTALAVSLVVNLIGFINGLLLLFGAVLWQPRLVLAHLIISCTLTIAGAIYVFVEIFISGLNADMLMGTLFGYTLLLMLAGGFLYAIYLYYKEIKVDYYQGDKTELVVNDCV